MIPSDLAYFEPTTILKASSLREALNLAFDLRDGIRSLEHLTIHITSFQGIIIRLTVQQLMNVVFCTCLFKSRDVPCTSHVLSLKLECLLLGQSVPVND